MVLSLNPYPIRPREGLQSGDCQLAQIFSRRKALYSRIYERLGPQPPRQPSTPPRSYSPPRSNRDRPAHSPSGLGLISQSLGEKATGEWPLKHSSAVAMTVGAAARLEASGSSGKCYLHIISIQRKLLCPAPNNYGSCLTLTLPTTEQLCVDGIHLLGLVIRPSERESRLKDSPPPRLPS